MSSVRLAVQRTLASLALLASVVACGPDVGVGTPTPEPPDLLPRPDIRLVFPGSQPNEDMPEAPIEVNAQAGSVAPSSDVWITNLDDAQRRGPQVVTASLSGSFAARVDAARVGDRIRFVVRLGTRHSLPQDLTVISSGPSRTLAARPPEALPCLTISPSEELTLLPRFDADAEAQFMLENGCTEAVTVERAAVRVGDGGFAYSAPQSIPAGERAAIEVVSTASVERLRGDVLLLDVATPSARGRYALGLWSISSDTSGKR